MTNNRGMSPLIALVMSVLMVAVGLLVLSVIVEMRAPLIAYNGDGSKMTVYANTVTTSDGMKYRVMVSTHYEPGKKTVRIVDMYSLESKYSSITGIMRADLNSWNELYSCSSEQLNGRVPCPQNDFKAERLLGEALKKTMTRANAIGNMEIFWSWEMGTKELIAQINKK